jgi:formylmethanofuran dehydrogenase subunit E
MNKTEFSFVGVVRNEINEPGDYRKIKEKDSTVEVFPEYNEALAGIEENDYLDIIFYFHKSEQKLQSDTSTYPGTLRGVFASRSPKRPNLIGITTVKLVRRDGNLLHVQGLDAINGTPVLDIKNCDTSMFAYETDNNPVHQGKLKTSPRIDIRNEIHAKRYDNLMIKAAQMHGHFCPGLAMGVMAAVYAMNRLEADSDGMEDLLAITETNNCFSDGVQFVTGCSFGNNSLIYKDLGKTAFALTRRDGQGVRVISRPESQQVIREAFPDFANLYQKVVAEQNHDSTLITAYRKAALDRAFGTLTLDFDKLFAVHEVKVEIPSYAKIHDSIVCAKCGESTMSVRSIQKEDGASICYTCSNSLFGYLDGNGIHI